MSARAIAIHGNENKRRAESEPGNKERVPSSDNIIYYPDYFLTFIQSFVFLVFFAHVYLSQNNKSIGLGTFGKKIFPDFPGGGGPETATLSRL